MRAMQVQFLFFAETDPSSESQRDTEIRSPSWRAVFQVKFIEDAKEEKTRPVAFRGLVLRVAG